MREIYLAGGCFWGTEHFMSLVHGVTATCVGYANSIMPNPTYEQVCTGNTGAAETVKVMYDDTITRLDFLLSLFFKTIDPTSLNKQGEDSGTQYRTGIYFSDPADEPTIRKALQELAKHYTKPLQVEICKLQNFHPAEEYHRDYLYKNPGGYCHIDRSLMAMAAQARDPRAQR